MQAKAWERMTLLSAPKVRCKLEGVVVDDRFESEERGVHFGFVSDLLFKGAEFLATAWAAGGDVAVAPPNGHEVAELFDRLAA